LNLLSLTLLALPLTLQAPPNGGSSLDQLVDQVIEYRKQRAELEKKESATLAEVRTRLKALEERLNQIDVKPVPPGPGPAPNPPHPPAPPVDPLMAALKAAYEADKGPTKAAQAMLLAELYKQAAALADDPEVLNTADLMGRILVTARSLKIDGLLPCRTLIAEECKLIGSVDPPVTLTDDVRAKAKAVFLRVAVAMKGVA
jgi:hypothetical protein